MSHPRLPVKRLGDVFLGKMLQNEARTSTDVKAPYLRAAHVQPQGRLIDVDGKTMWFGQAELDLHDLRADDVVIVEGGAGYGRSAVVPGDRPGWGFQNSIVRVRPRPGLASGRFLNYALQSALSAGEIEVACFTATIPHFTADKVGGFLVPAPPVERQRTIADYLDRETARIDTLIEEQQRLIAMLRERRDGVVAQAFLQSAGTETKLKHAVDDVTVGIVVQPSRWYVDEGVPALRGVNVKRGSILLNDLVHISEKGHKAHPKSQLQSRDVVVVRTGQAGAAAKVPDELDGVNAIDILIIRPGDGTDPDFLVWYLNSPLAASRIAVGSVGAIQGHFNVGALRELPIPVLTCGEQHRIAAHLDEQVSKIDRMIEETERFVELSRERRSALIAAAVTGQIDVQAVA